MIFNIMAIIILQKTNIEKMILKFGCFDRTIHWYVFSCLFWSSSSSIINHSNCIENTSLAILSNISIYIKQKQTEKHEDEQTMTQFSFFKWTITFSLVQQRLDWQRMWCWKSSKCSICEVALQTHRSVLVLIEEHRWKRRSSSPPR